MINKRFIKNYIDVMIIEHLELMAIRITLADMKPRHKQSDVTKLREAVSERVDTMKEKLHGKKKKKDNTEGLRPSGLPDPAQE